MLATESPPFEDVVDIVRPLFPKIVTSTITGFETFTKIKAHAETEHGSSWRARVQSDLLQAEVTAAARREFGKDAPPLAAYIDYEGALELFRADSILLAFKKGRYGVAQNHQSGQQTRIRTHRHQLVFDGVLCHFVHVVYEVDDIFARLLDVRLACPNGYDRNFWAISMLDEIHGVRELPLSERKATQTKPAASSVKIRKRKA